MNMPTLSVFLCVCILAVFSVHAESGKYDPDLENPASTAPGYETLNKMKDKLDRIGESLGNAKDRFDRMIGVKPASTDNYDMDTVSGMGAPAGDTTSGPAPAARRARTPPAPTPEEARNNKKRLLDIMSVQADQNAADYAVARARCNAPPNNVSPSQIQQCLESAYNNYHGIQKMTPEQVESMRIQAGLPAKVDITTSNDPLIHQMFDPQAVQGASTSLQNIMDTQQQAEAEQEARRRVLAEQEQQRQVDEQRRQLAAQRAREAQQAQEAQRLQAQRDAETAAQWQNVTNAITSGINAAAAARRAPARVPTYVPPPSSYSGATVPAAAYRGSKPASSSNSTRTSLPSSGTNTCNSSTGTCGTRGD